MEQLGQRETDLAGVGERLDGLADEDFQVANAGAEALADVTAAIARIPAHDVNEKRHAFDDGRVILAELVRRRLEGLDEPEFAVPERVC